MKKCLGALSAFALVITVSACTKSSPTSPSADASASSPPTSVIDRSGVTLTTPQPVTPTAGQNLKWSDQPFTLTVKNGVSSARSGLTYSFQVASDIAFANVVFSQDGVAEGSGGQTSLKISQLGGSQSYFWRARASSGTSAGLYTATRQFVVGPPIIVQAPVPVSPAQGGTLNGTAALIATNAATSGPVGQMAYRFDISDSSSFGNIVFTATVNQQANQTSVTVNTQLVTNATYYWRVQAIDTTNQVAGPYSSVSSFKYVPFDMTQATIYNSPSDLGFWPVTTHITNVNLSPDAMVVDFDKRDGPNRWPDEPFGSGSIEYTLGMCVNINSHWDCSAVVLFWYGRELTASGLPSQVSYNWFYDAARWGPMTGYQPSQGETVGFFVGSGGLRGRTDPGYVTCPRVCERSDVALVPWAGDNGTANYTFGSALKSIQTRRR